MRLERAPKNLTAMVLGTPDFDSIMPVLMQVCHEMLPGLP